MTVDTKLNDRMTVHEVMRRFPRTVVVFNSFGIRSSCGRDAPIASAAIRDGADLQRLMDALRRAVAVDG